jgi:hypothetical protein
LLKTVAFQPATIGLVGIEYCAYAAWSAADACGKRDNRCDGHD